jgi:alpha-amylase
MVSNPMRPWWERYQPTSYKLDSRSGTEAEFADMVERCNNAGVRIYVDAVINHMCGSERGNGTDTAHCFYNADTEGFPCVPYDKNDFNGPWDCPTGNQGIMNWDDPVQVRNCRLVGLLDLATTTDDVRAKIAGYLNKLIDYGVAGIRIDAAKHMWPADIKNYMDRTKDLPTRHFPSGSRMLVYQEVIDWGNSPIRNDEYIDSGRLALFTYGTEISQAVRGGGGRGLSAFNLPGTNWGRPWLDDVQSLVFVDNHDTQRNGANILTYKNGADYKMAVGFMLALPYGAARVMSSYYFENSNQGPPHNPDYSTSHVIINADGTCGGGWVCEHRWPEIAAMAQFRWVTAGQNIVHWTSSGNNKVGFGRGNVGFYAINKDGGGWSQTFQTNLPAGTYCDMISGGLGNGGCKGKSFTVGGDGRVSVDVSSSGSTIPVVAFTTYSRIGGPTLPTLPPTKPTQPGSWTTKSTQQYTYRTGPPSTTTNKLGTGTTSRGTTPSQSGREKTVVFLYRPTQVGQNVFIRGGLDGAHNTGCTADFSTDACKIPITHITQVPTSFLTYLDWEKGDTYLNWQGAQPGQGEYSGQPAEGTPLAWSTNQQGQTGYQPLNKYGPHYWMVEVEMDCSKTDNGWFEFKGYLDGWEGNIAQGQCTGPGAGSPPYTSNNHFGRCGYVNVFRWGENNCQINNL